MALDIFEHLFILYASETLGLGSFSTCVYICAYKIIKIAETFKTHQH